MNICAIICEYNPLHYGHIYHMQRARQLSGCDALLCLMSGNLVQRGEPAICDKHTRARAALLAGADVVVELPTVFAIGNAELFSSGAVRMLGAVPAVKTLCFGSECDDIETLKRAAKAEQEESPQFKAALTEALDAGNSYPRSREIALRSSQNASADILCSPNNILAACYLRAIERYAPHIEPIAVQRQGAGYHQTSLVDGSFPSATAVRLALQSLNLAHAPNFAPEPIAAMILSAISPAERMRDGLSALTMSTLDSSPKAAYEAIYDLTSDIAARIINEVPKTADYSELISRVKSKFFTMARLKRILLYCVLGITREAVADALAAPPYYNVLAVKKECRDLLKELPLPIARARDYSLITDMRTLAMAQLDERAAQIYSAISGKRVLHKGASLF